MTCPVCGTVAVPGARFCHNCGSALPGVRGLPATERRVVTVLFGDLSDFTAWAEDLDPERVGAVTDRVLAALAGAVKTFGGHVDKLTGDGIMGVFGAPVAHEDDPERAIRAALSMQRAVRRVLDDERGGGAPLGLRVGLNTGEVVAGIQAALEYTVVGDTVNTAARLADSAAVGAVYSGATTAAVTRHLASWRRLRPLRLKGKREPVEAYELLGLHDAPGTRSGLGDEAPFVGREAELGRIAGRLAEVVDRGEPRVLVITAEAGVGKSRFAAEAARFASSYGNGPGRYAAGAGAQVLSVRCVAFGERRRLAPLTDLVRIAVGLPADSATALTRAVVEDRLRRLAQRLVRAGATPGSIAIEPLLSLLGYGEPGAAGVPAGSGDWASTGAPVAESDADATPAAVAALLDAMTTEAPLVVVVDDLNDATADTIDALGNMLSQLSGPVLVLLLGRPELVRSSGALTRLADAEVHTLSPLRGADAARLLSSYLGGGRLAQADEDRLLATAQGNPFYLAELVTLLLERGALTPVGGRHQAAPADQNGHSTLWRLAPGSLSERLLSRDLAAVLAARIDALPADSREVLRDAAVIGDVVPATALVALCERRTSRTGRPAAVLAVELERAVDELLQRRMLHRTREGYAFSTPLMREAAYAGIGRGDLAERHAFLANWAAGWRSQEPCPGGPGDRSKSPTDRGAGMPDTALDAFIAEHAERATALADAVGLRPDAAARLVRPLGVTALSRLAKCAVTHGEPAAAVDYAERAAALSEAPLPPADQVVRAQALLQHGRPDEAVAYAEQIGTDAGSDPLSRAEALVVAGQAHRLAGDQERAVTAWQEALVVAESAGLPGPRTEAMRRLGMADYLAGRLGEAGGRFTEAIRIAVDAGDRRSQAWALQNLAWVATARGDFVGADRALHQAARLFAELHDPFGRAWLRGTTAFTRMLAGRLAEAQRLARAFLPFGERVGEGWAVGTLRAVEAFAAAERGELAEADREARRAYRDFAAVDDQWGRGFALVVRGVVARGLGEPDHAADLLAEALGYSEQTGHPLLIGTARTVRGLIALDRGDADTAEREARAVLAVTEPHDVLPSAQVGPRALLAAAKLASGDAAAAAQLLAPVVASPQAPSLLFPRRQAVATYAQAMLAEGREEEALRWARRAAELPAEDIRSSVVIQRVLAGTLAAAGRLDEARVAADEAVRRAYSTQQMSERAASDALLAALGSPPSAAPRDGAPARAPHPTRDGWRAVVERRGEVPSDA